MLSTLRNDDICFISLNRYNYHQTIEKPERIEQMNDQIVTINTTLEEGEEQINIDQLDLDGLIQAIENFEENI